MARDSQLTNLATTKRTICAPRMRATRGFERLLLQLQSSVSSASIRTHPIDFSRGGLSIKVCIQRFVLSSAHVNEFTWWGVVVFRLLTWLQSAWLFLQRQHPVSVCFRRANGCPAETVRGSVLLD